MSNSSPPDPGPGRLRDDEPIALLVALLAFGAIFWWAISQRGTGWDVSTLIPGVSSSPTPSFVLPSPSPSATLTPGIGGTTDPTALVDPQPTISPGESAYTAPTPRPTITPIPSPNNTLRPAPSVTPPGTPIAFKDVPQNYWAYPFITALSARGIVGGFPDGTFKPDQPVTRAEFAVQLQKAFTKPDTLPPKQFSDLPPGNQWANSVDKAVKGNFLSGYPDGTFRPNQKVSRVEAVSSMSRGLGLAEPADSEAILQSYEDRQQVPTWARGRVAAAIQAGIFSGDPDTKLLNPNQAASRSDIAALVYKGLEETKAISK